MNSSTASADLQSILSTLARLSQPLQPSPSPVSAPERAGQPSSTRDLSHRPSQNPKPIDPASITTWQEGLRCVTKLAQQNNQFVSTLQKMMRDQKANEMRWYSERQALKQTQATRAASAAKAQSILKSLNQSHSQPSTPAAGVDPAVESANQQAELAEFDRKIHRAQANMETAMCAELKALGVPFFGTLENLVFPDDYDLAKEQIAEDHPKWSPLVTQSQLMDLRRRIVQHLEDLYRD